MSLVLHGLGLTALAWWVVTHDPRPWFAPPTKAEVARLTPPPVPPPPRPKPRRPPPPPPLPKPEPFDDSQPFHDDSGEHDAHGTANRSTAGDQPMRAERGLEQADLVRSKPADPTLIDPSQRQTAQAGQKTPVDAVPAPPVAPRQGSPRPDFVTVADTPRADPTAQATAKPAAARGMGPLPVPAVVQPPVDDAPPPAASGVKQVAVTPSPAVVPPAPPVREQHGREATPSDSESVPFAKDATVSFHAGRMEARQGLKVDMVNPRFGLASEDDLGVIGELNAVFNVSVRPDRSVATVEVSKSSGSPNVDEDCKRALYACTFETRKDKDGNPVPTLWTVVYH